ncbi:hypothetical protein GP486_004817 [Trichoglossum hirsutum]|uniref:HEAT repeat domain-containing protein n=1 Tax=Trichoglossum hirsutum TaxID=265104 RepID=A0A9P8RNE9_9PEZI|nr:hypothetical protein GP486_004817 [Trichoglossum hirsutum]
MDGYVRGQAAQALGRQSSLPTEVIKSLIDLLKDTWGRARDTRDQVAEALGRQSNLPAEAIKDLVDLLKDKASNVQYQAARALGKRLIEQLYRILETLELSTMESLYGSYLVKQSVAQIAPLYIEANTLYFYTSSGLEAVRLSNEISFRWRLRKVQKQIGIPKVSRVKLVRGWGPLVDYFHLGKARRN